MPYAKRVSAAALLAVLPIFFCPAAGSANAAENETAPPAVVERPRVDQFIVKLRKPRTADVAAEAARPYRASSFDVSTLVLQRVVERVLRDERRAPQGAGAGVRTRRAANALGYTRAISGAAHVVGLAAPVDAVDAAALAKRLQAQPEVEYAEPDYRLRAHMEPTDPLYQQQWSYHETEAGANLSAAWDVTTGSANVVTAVIDSGYRMHSDLAANLLPGYDFVSDPFSANDGDGRDSDASDPGNWATLEDSLQCDGTIGWVTNSTWHGTHVAGTIGAVANNGVGGVGVAWQGRIVPVRVLGKCGGVVSDIIDAM
ncbi:MAG: serine protease, partial [Paraburkholderia sp.]|nr:serine protease [Paraburkholderia sp.]